MKVYNKNGASRFSFKQIPEINMNIHILFNIIIIMNSYRILTSTRKQHVYIVFEIHKVLQL